MRIEKSGSAIGSGVSGEEAADFDPDDCWSKTGDFFSSSSSKLESLVNEETESTVSS